jgi:hypothetical protein
LAPFLLSKPDSSGRVYDKEGRNLLITITAVSCCAYIDDHYCIVGGCRHACYLLSSSLSSLPSMRRCVVAFLKNRLDLKLEELDENNHFLTSLLTAY